LYLLFVISSAVSLVNSQPV